MKRKITRLALGAKCGGFTASGPGAPWPVVPAARNGSPNIPASARAPNPVLLARINSRRESRRLRYEFQCGFMLGSSSQFTSVHVYVFVRCHQGLAETLPRQQP